MAISEWRQIVNILLQLNFHSFTFQRGMDHSWMEISEWRPIAHNVTLQIVDILLQLNFHSFTLPLAHFWSDPNIGQSENIDENI